MQKQIAFSFMGKAGDRTGIKGDAFFKSTGSSCERMEMFFWIPNTSKKASRMNLTFSSSMKVSTSSCVYINQDLLS